MTTIDVNFLLDRPIHVVWDFLTDLRNEPRWWRGVRRSDLLTGVGGVGTRYWLTARLVGLPADAEVLVTVFEPPRRFVIKATGRLAYRCEYLLDPVATKTRLRLSVEIEQLPQWLSPLFRIVLRHNVRRLNRVLAH